MEFWNATVFCIFLKNTSDIWDNAILKVRTPMKRYALVLTLLTLATAGYAASIPRPAADVPVTLTDGRQVKPSDFNGKVVIVAYILST
jgi:hypothetical protein